MVQTNKQTNKQTNNIKGINYKIYDTMVIYYTTRSNNDTFESNNRLVKTRLQANSFILRNYKDVYIKICIIIKQLGRMLITNKVNDSSYNLIIHQGVY